MRIPKREELPAIKTNVSPKTEVKGVCIHLFLTHLGRLPTGGGSSPPMVSREGVLWGVKDTEGPDACIPVQTLPHASDDLVQFPSSLSFLTRHLYNLMGTCRPHEESGFTRHKTLNKQEAGENNGMRV